MKRRGIVVALALAGVFAAGAMVGRVAVADTAKESAKAPDVQLPPGWTAEDMAACMAAATPGKPHQELAKGVGTWKGKSTMWMAPGAPPMQSECSSVATMVMGGRYLRIESSGEMPGMGTYSGLGFYGFDNVSQKPVAAWVDNMGTGIASGTGEVSADGKVTTYKYTVNCPITKKPTTVREVQTCNGDNSLTLDMYGEDPKSGKEYQVMKLELTRQ